MTFEEWGKEHPLGYLHDMYADWKADRGIILQERAQLAEGLLKAEQKMFKLIEQRDNAESALYDCGVLSGKKKKELVEQNLKLIHTLSCIAKIEDDMDNFLRARAVLEEVKE